MRRIDAPRAWMWKRITGEVVVVDSEYEGPYSERVRIVRETDWRLVMKVVKAVYKVADYYLTMPDRGKEGPKLDKSAVWQLWFRLLDAIEALEEKGGTDGR